MAMYPINVVPQFIWDKIIQFLDDPKDLALARRVSKEFKEIMDNLKWESKWRGFVEERFSHFIPEYHCKEKINWMRLCLQYAKNERKVNEAMIYNQKKKTLIPSRFNSSKIVIDEYIRLESKVDKRSKPNCNFGIMPTRYIQLKDGYVRLREYIASKFSQEIKECVFTNFKKLTKQPGEDNSVPEIQYYLGLCYLYSFGTGKERGATIDLKKAFKWHKMAADQGFAPAQFEMGKTYLVFRTKVPRISHEEMWSYYQKAAEQGFAPAQFELGKGYYLRYKNPLEAFKYLKMVADQGWAEAQHELGLHYSKRGESFNPLEAFRYFKMAAEQGVVAAQFELGSCYYNGFGTPFNHEEAFKYYQMAAENGWMSAYYDLGVCYQKGIGTPINPLEAFKCYQIAMSGMCERDLVSVACDLGHCYEAGLGTPANPVKAFEYYQLAKSIGPPSRLYDLGICSALYDLGRCYENDIGTTVDLEKAFRHYQKAARQDWVLTPHDFASANPGVVEKFLSRDAKIYWALAQCVLGDCYAKGIGTQANDEEALRCYQRAADRGFAPAKKFLAAKRKAAEEIAAAAKKPKIESGNLGPSGPS
jgi:uncharacterized protein